MSNNLEEVKNNLKTAVLDEATYHFDMALSRSDDLGDLYKYDPKILSENDSYSMEINRMVKSAYRDKVTKFINGISIE